MKKLLAIIIAVLFLPIGVAAQIIIRRSALASIITNPTISGQIFCGTDSAAIPCYSWSANSNRGLFNDTTNNGVGISVAGTQTSVFNATGLLFTTDNTLDIGASSSTRPRNGFFGTSVTAGSSMTVAGTTKISNHTLVGDVTTSASFLDISGGNGSDFGGRAVFYGSSAASPNTGDIKLFTGSTGFGAVRFQLQDTAKNLTESSATDVVQVDVASSTTTGFIVDWTVEANDSTDFQARRGSTYFVAVNKAGTETCTAADVGTPQVAVSTGTLTNTVACSTTPTNGVMVTMNAVSSLTQTTLRVIYTIRRDVGTGNITPQ